MTRRQRSAGAAALAITLAMAGCASDGEGDVSLESGSSGGLRPLSSEPVPQPGNGHIVNQTAAIRLGKALFWDVQAGSDGQMACASCHFTAGADDRTFNTLNPGNDAPAMGQDDIFASGGVTAAGQTFTPSNITTDDRVGSQGVAAANFEGLDPDPAQAADFCAATPVKDFGSLRQVTGRNAPTVIGAVFFRDAFWDGRANHAFNGGDPFGQTANAAGEAAPAIGSVALTNSALASQSVGPPVNAVEMSCAKRVFNSHVGIGTKLLARPPLRLQQVALDDSVLGQLANPSGPGLVCSGAPCSYAGLIRDAFGDDLANAAEANFSLIWGEAVQAYEATLIPDQTPLDRYLAGNTSALPSQQQRGLGIFQGKGNCTKCHTGAVMSDATVSSFAANGPTNRDGGDQGFHNLGVRPTSEDLGRGGSNGLPFVFSVSGASADFGAFKTPGLRNVGLTAPYFHNGGKATLADVVDFYSRGGDFANAERARDLQPRGFSSDESASLVEFLTNGLTDCRVKQQRAPFDHPALPIPNRASDLPATGANGLGNCP